MISSAKSSAKPSDAAAPQLTRRDAEAAAAAFPALMIEAERLAHTVAAGFHGRRRAGPGENFWQHRPFSFGDSIAAIDWRQSARAADRLYVRQNEWEAAAAVWLWRDPGPGFDFSSTADATTKRRRADVLAVALAILLSAAGERVGVLGDRTRPYAGRGAPALVLQALLGPAASAVTAPTAAGADPGARFVFFSDFYAAPESAVRAVEAAAAAGARGVLVQIVDPAEEDFPFAGRADFRDLTSTEHRLFGDAAAIKEAYTERFLAHRGALEELCRRCDWRFIAHRTSAPATDCLAALFAALEKRRR